MVVTGVGVCADTGWEGQDDCSRQVTWKQSPVVSREKVTQARGLQVSGIGDLGASCVRGVD